jgi:hypothetical protein
MKKQKRYRQRQYLRKALARVYVVLLRNSVLGIKPDVKTALLAGEMIGHLRLYLAKARVAEPISPDEEQFRQVVKLKAAMKRESQARYRFPDRPRERQVRGR